jgi:Na+/proline symporter
MASPLALDTDQAKTIGILVIIGLVVVGAILSMIITAIIARLIMIVVVLVLVTFVWTQRSAIQSAAKRCDASFFGVHLTPSNPAIKQRCQNLSR